MSEYNLKKIPKDFREVLKAAKIEDITFLEESVSVHSELDDLKKGFKPIKVAGIPVPSNIRVSYVEGCDSKGRYWYVVSWVDTNREHPNEYEVDSEKEAKAAVLKELRMCVEMVDRI